MEFFTIVNIETTPEVLQNISVSQLYKYCTDIDKVLRVEDNNTAEIYCIWGTFTVLRQVILGGIRFSLVNCPNALVWTITTGFEPAPDKVVLHATINRTHHEADFIDSIEQFLQSWKMGLEKTLHLLET